MENVGEKERERERRRESDTASEAPRQSAAGERKRGIEGERRNTWFYLQKQSLRGTNTGRH